MDGAERQAILAMPALDPPEGVEPNFANPSNLNELANGVAVAGLVITTITILIRLHSWIFILTSWKGRLEAALVISGFASYIGFAYGLLRIGNVELGWWVHQWDVTIGDTIGFSYASSLFFLIVTRANMVRQWVYTAGILYNSAIAPVKVAILIEWMRIFAPRTRNTFFWMCQIVLWLNVAWYTAATIVEAMQCTPRELVWDPTVKGTCLPTKAVEVISSSINVVSDIVILVAPQFVIWRLQLSGGKKIGVALIFAVGLFGTISAIFRLVATQAYLRSKDATYTVGPVGFWAYSELTSVFLVYGLPAVPAAYSGASTRVTRYYTQRTQKSSASKSGQSSKVNNVAPWQEGRKGSNNKYRNLDKDSLPLSSIDTKSGGWDSTVNDRDGSTPPPANGVVRTIEIRSDEVQTGISGGPDRDSGEDVLLRQHPWVQV
ncbi:hypothetical protein E0Z10_g9908 [Xylaria hypoxylon]|uniref:Rhodopsin domain-containing protein n=1 Tax=Xylaria hypoxylon TaxID=37992 RepID=A0A4Z0YQK2_9PEZI|nr:hypothetical protein E0Z10_g9908 [Xylaria hypoxylon]